MSLTGAALLVALMASFDVAALRWLRISQREHYLPGAATRFAVRWWRLPENTIVAGGAVVSLAALGLTPFAVLPAALACVVAPFGLGIKGRTSPLAWTARLRRLALAAAALHLLVVGAGLAGGSTAALVAAAVTALAAPLVIDLAAAAMAPIEARSASKWETKAKQRLAGVKPRVVAITGSYGKTTAKGYLAHLLTGSVSVVATPASFNNRAGLSRAINEHLTPGTDVFIAEMGTYGQGEIAELCRWLPPDIAVITSIGPVHLERMKTEANIVLAKSEILEDASVAVVSVDHPLLRTLAEIRASGGQRVVRCGTGGDADADVRIDGDKLLVDGEVVCEVPDEHRTVNLACAVAVAREVGVPMATITGRLAGLPVAAHRLQAVRNDNGVTVLDDTYNANPAGAARALQRLAALGDKQARRIVVTPGMVELGSKQRAANEEFAAAAAEIASDVIVVGRTNRAALVAGARRGGAPVHLVDVLPQAVAWVREHASPGDVVLYENDLPDHYA